MIKDCHGNVLPGDVLHEDNIEETTPSSNGDDVASSASLGSEESTNPLTKSIDSNRNLSFSLPRTSTPVTEADNQEPLSPIPLPVEPLQQLSDPIPVQTIAPTGPSGSNVPVVSLSLWMMRRSSSPP